MKSFFFGLTVPIQSTRLILSRPRLLFWSILPLLITFALYFFLFNRIAFSIENLMIRSLSVWGVHFPSWLMLIFSWLSKLITFIFSIFTFSYVANMMACPLNDFLAEAAESYCQPPVSPKLSMVKTVSTWRRIYLILLDFVKTGTMLVFQLGVLLTSWIPYLNLISLGLSFLLITLQFISYPQTRRGQGITAGFSFIRNHFGACLGFGTSTGLLLMIPIFSCFMIPIAVVGGTLLYANRDRR